MRLKVGQKVWCNVHNFGRRTELKETHITKIGRKYVYVDLVWHDKFHIDTLVEHNESNYKGRMYLDKQIYLDEKELEANCKQLHKVFDNYRRPEISLEQSRRILKILEESED